MNKSSGKKSRNFLSLQREKVGGKTGKNSKGKKFFSREEKNEGKPTFSRGKEKLYILRIYTGFFPAYVRGKEKGL